MNTPVNPRLPPSTCGQLACILEVVARKPGNVHRFADFEDVGLVDFLASAAVFAPVLDRAAEWGVGRAVLEGVRRTRAVTATNTNLGMVLLLVPLAAVPPTVPLAEGIGRVLADLSIEDAVHTYEAIRLAQPGGLGQVEQQDVHAHPTQTLREVMALAAEHDRVARQYARGYEDVLTLGYPALLAALDRAAAIEEAVIACHLTLLAECGDSLIARKRGQAEAVEAGRRARHVLELGWPESETGQQELARFDTWLRAVGHERNPGTTADLVTACLFVALREGTMNLPWTRCWSSSRLAGNVPNSAGAQR